MLDALTKCSAAFSAVRSFHCRINDLGGTVLVDYRAPDTMRFSGMRESSVLVGNKAYAQSDASWLPIDPKEPLFLRDLVMTPRIMVKWARLTTPVFVRAFGRGPGAMRMFRYASFDSHTQLITTVWLYDTTHLPYAANYDTFDTHTTLAYSGYNAGAAFAVPPSAGSQGSPAPA